MHPMKKHVTGHLGRNADNSPFSTSHHLAPGPQTVLFLYINISRPLSFKAVDLRLSPSLFCQSAWLFCQSAPGCLESALFLPQTSASQHLACRASGQMSPARATPAATRKDHAQPCVFKSSTPAACTVDGLGERVMRGCQENPGTGRAMCCWASQGTPS